jgi:hypothetical protein
MKYPIPSRVPLPTPRPDQPAWAGPQAFPPRPMAPQMPMQGGNRFMDFLRNNSEALGAMSAGLLSGRTGPEQFGMGMQGFSQVRGAAKEKAEEKRKKNATIEWLRQNAPEYADAVDQGVLSAGDAYKMKLQAQTPKQYEPMSTVGKINSDFKNGIIDQATRDALITKAAQSEGMEMVSDGQGGFTFRQGAGIGQSGGKMTESQAKANIFATRGEEANRLLSGLEGQGTSLGQLLISGAPLGNYALTPEYRQYDQAKRDFVNAILRQESGAVIADSEFANAEKQYFPQPGDDPATIEQKRRNRETAIKAIREASGRNPTDPQPAQGDVIPAEDYFR